MFTEFITPVEFMNLYNIALKIEEKKQEEAQGNTRKQYTK